MIAIVRSRAARMLFVLLALGASFAVAGCSSFGGATEEWVEADIKIASERVLRTVAMQAMKQNGFPPGTEDGNAVATVSSSWKVQLQPFKSQGTREKAHLQYEEKEAGVWHVYVRVEKDTNEELAKPLDLAQAQWESAGDDRESASRVLRTLQTMLGIDFQLAPKGESPITGPLTDG